MLVTGVFALVFLAFFSFLVVSNVRLYKRSAAVEHKIEATKAEISRLQEENQLYRAKVDRSNDPDFLEKVARERYNLKKPGEHVAVVIPAEEKSEQTKQETRERESVPWWRKVLAAIGF